MGTKRQKKTYSIHPFSFWSIMKYALTHFVAANTIASIPALDSDKWSCSDAFMWVTAYCTANNPKFLIPTTIIEMDN